jgi:hypothetical protein
VQEIMHQAYASTLPSTLTEALHAFPNQLAMIVPRLANEPISLFNVPWE